MIQSLDRPKNNFKIGISLMIIADLTCAVQAISVKTASFYFSISALVFIRFLVNLILLYSWVFFKEGKKGIHTLYKTKSWKQQIIRALSGVGAVYCFYSGLVLMSIDSATLLFFTSPIFVPLVARIWFKIAFINRLWWSLGLSFLGIVIVLHPGTEVFNPFAFIPLFGAILGSISTVSLRALHYTDSSKNIMAYYFTIGLILSAVIFVSSHKLTLEKLTFYTVLILMFVGIASFVFQIFFTLSSKYAPARFLSPFIYGVFIFSSIGDYFLFQKKLHMGTIIGFLFILLGAILMVFIYPKEDRTFVKKKKY